MREVPATEAHARAREDTCDTLATEGNVHGCGHLARATGSAGLHEVVRAQAIARAAHAKCNARVHASTRQAALRSSASLYGCIVVAVVMKVKVEHEEHIKYCAIHHHKLNKSTVTIDNEVDNVAQHEQEDIVQHVHDVDDAKDVIVADEGSEHVVQCHHDAHCERRPRSPGARHCCTLPPIGCSRA